MIAFWYTTLWQYDDDSDEDFVAMETTKASSSCVDHAAYDIETCEKTISRGSYGEESNSGNANVEFGGWPCCSKNLFFVEGEYE